jgi:hypothetical protein
MTRNARLLPAFFFFTVLMSGAAIKSDRFRITILAADSQTLNTNPDQPTRDCDLANYSGYCHERKVALVRNTMRVQEGNGNPFVITCVWDSRWSKCVALPIGQTFDARRDKHGITIFYENEKGGASKQLYTVVESPQGSKPGEAPAANAVSTVQAPTPVVPEGNREKIKCNFNSTPAGAEITLDGRYVGNTPSTIGLSTGSHVVVLFMPGFVQWKRDLSVGAGSEVNVSANLQKTQP